MLCLTCEYLPCRHARDAPFHLLRVPASRAPLFHSFFVSISGMHFAYLLSHVS